MNKTVKNYVLVTLFGIISLCYLGACKNDLNGNGSVLVKVDYSGTRVSRSLVYLNRDSLYHPDSLNDEFDRQGRADAAGEASFHNLEPGKYYFFAEGREPGNKAIVRGIDSIVVKKRFRQNTYEVTVKTVLE